MFKRKEERERKRYSLLTYTHTYAKRTHTPAIVLLETQKFFLYKYINMLLAEHFTDQNHELVLYYCGFITFH